MLSTEVQIIPAEIPMACRGMAETGNPCVLRSRSV
jgi:hypothetical protein